MELLVGHFPGKRGAVLKTPAEAWLDQKITSVFHEVNLGWSNRRNLIHRRYRSGARCQLAETIFDISGSMCIHWSGMGNNKKEEGKSNVLFLIWLVCHAKILGTPLLLHENVKNFSSEYLKEKANQLGYTHVGTIPTTGADAGLDAASRPRVCSGNHMSKSCFLHGVFFDRYMIYDIYIYII